MLNSTENYSNNEAETVREMLLAVVLGVKHFGEQEYINHLMAQEPSDNYNPEAFNQGRDIMAKMARDYCSWQRIKQARS